MSRSRTPSAPRQRPAAEQLGMLDMLLGILAPPPLDAPPPADSGPRVIQDTLGDMRSGASAEEVHRLVDAALAELLRGAWPRTPGEFTAWAGRVLGRPYESGTFTLDDACDAFEGAVNLHVLQQLGPLAAPGAPGIRARLEALRAMEEQYFRARHASGALVARAQFSTPLPLAAAAAYLLGARPEHRILEPQAGTGNLVTWLRGVVSALHVNEVDPRRLAVLAALGFQPTSEDALRLQLSPARYDGILMNPPFGSVSRGRYHGFGATAFPATDVAQRFVAAALASLAESGRLVTVMPAATLDEAGAGFRTWLREHFAPVAYIEAPEESYRSRGARVGTVTMVVDKTAPTSGTAPLIVRRPSWEDWFGAVETFRAEGPHFRAAAGAAAEPAPPVPEPEPAPPPPPPPVAPEPPAGQPGPPPGAAAARTQATLDLSLAVEPPIVIPMPAGPVEIGAYETRDLPPVEWHEGDPEVRREEIARAAESPVFTPYRIGFRNRRAPHPRLVVETRSMAGMPAPPIVETFRSPLVNSAWGRAGELGGVSDEQADAALRCLSAWRRGHGMLISDAVGLGKAREAAILILEAIQRGRRRIVYTTKNETNVRDAIAEFRRVASGSEHGPFPAEIVCVGDFANVKKGLADLPQPNGPCLYITHAYNLAAFSDALVEVAPDALVADEAHEFANIRDSARGAGWTKLHRPILRNRGDVVYFTATAGVTVQNLAYLYGLRLWPIGGFRSWVSRKLGLATAKEDPDAVQAVQDAEARDSLAVGETGGGGGEAGGDETKDGESDSWGSARNDAFSLRITPAETEQIMREMKGSGHYLARDLFRAGVEFSIAEVDLLGDGPAAVAARRRYDATAELCRDVSRAVRGFGRLNEQVKSSGLDRAMIQAYLKQVLFELRLDTVIRLAEEALREGRQVVISLHSVAGDGPQEEGVSAEDSVRKLNTRIEAAINRINTRHVEKADDGETVEYVDLGDIPEALLAREALLERLAALKPLQDPVRRIEDHFGRHNVAAITGRFPARARSRLKAEFQAGLRSVAIISQAGKVGISLHDVNGRRRRMIVADYEWSATMFLQELGRVDRTGQLSPPEIILVASNAGGERKFSATIAARMASLGATCKGSAESTGTDALDAFEMSGDIPVAAMKNAVEKLPDELREYFTGSKFVTFTQCEDGSERLIPVRRPHDADMRAFLLDLLMFPIEAAHQVMCRWEEERDVLMTGEVAEMLAARRTGRSRGEVLRTTQLRAQPVLTLYEILNDAGERMGILQGYVTEYIGRIQDVRGPDPRNGLPKTRRYMQFTLSDGAGMISGLELTRWEALAVREAFGEHDGTALTPQDAWEALRAGAKVPVQGPPGTDWLLHPRRNGHFEIRGASLTRHQGVLRPLRDVVGFEPTTRYLFVRPEYEALCSFLEHFPTRAPTSPAEEEEGVQAA